MADLRFCSWAQTPIGAARSMADDGRGGPLAPGGLEPKVVLSGPGGGEIPAPALDMLGPGGVLGLDPGLIVRVDPPPGDVEAQDTCLAAVEFAAPELPWELTPARASEGDRLRPWIVLVVVELSAPLSFDGPVPVLEVAIDELPDLRDSWGWAHVQMPSPDAAPPAGISGLGGQTISRLLCPRRLSENTRYRACVVPAFAGGRDAGLGITDARALASVAAAWDVDRPGPVRLPVYYSWEFATGPSGDFETLVRRLGPVERDRPAFGARDIDLSQPWKELDPLSASEQLLPVQGVLRPFGDPPPSAVDDATWRIYQTRIAEELSAPARRLTAEGRPAGETGAVSPPLYGGRHVNQSTVEVDAEDVGHFHGGPEFPWPWPDWLNVHPANRIAAGLGAEYVRENQERLMASAWDQVGPIREANRLRAAAELSTEVAGSAHRRHVTTMTSGEIVSFAAPAGGRLPTVAGAGGPTMTMEVGVSPLPDAAASTAFARFLRPSGPVARGDATLRDRIVAGGLRNALNVPDPPNLVARIALAEPMSAGSAPVALAADAALTTALASFVARQLIRLDAIGSVAAVNGLEAVGTLLDERVPSVAGDAMSLVRAGEPTTLSAAIAGDLARTTDAVNQTVEQLLSAQPDGERAVDAHGVQIEHEALRTRLVDALHPGDRASRRLATRVELGELTEPDPLSEVMDCPQFPVPAALALIEQEPEWFLPGIGAFPHNRAALLDVNGEFVAAYVVGLNHELMGELRWREYPTDLRGTAFRRFWPRPDGEDDILPIAEWTHGGLGDHLTLGDDALCALLIRGDVVRRFPNLIVSALRASPGVLPPVPGVGEHRDPLFALRVDDATMAFAFAIERSELEASPEREPGWFVVLQEHSHRIRFGFDAPGANAGFHTWNDLAWPPEPPEPPEPPGAAVPTPRGFARADQPLRRPDAEPSDAEWARDSADIARIALQRPFRLVIHASALVGR